jgi:hypothetical protein
MSANDILVLDASLTETKRQRAPDLSESDFFEIFAAVLKCAHKIGQTGLLVRVPT